jgi:hypothetical protein
MMGRTKERKSQQRGKVKNRTLKNDGCGTQNLPDGLMCARPAAREKKKKAGLKPGLYRRTGQSAKD